MRRASIPQTERAPCFVYLDEAHSFMSASFATMLSEVRKYGLGLFLTHKYLEQLEEEVQSAVLGNVGTIICFRLGAADAKVMEQDFYPVFSQDDFVNLPKYHIYVKLLIDGSAGRGFSAKTII